jgi:hypothetical protein
MSVRTTGAVLVGTAPDEFVGCPPQATRIPNAAVIAATCLRAVTG